MSDLGSWVPVCITFALANSIVRNMIWWDMLSLNKLKNIKFKRS